MKPLFKSTTVGLSLLLLAAFSYADLCPIPPEEGKWGGGTYQNSKNTLYQFTLKTSCESIYETSCGHETCYNGFWDAMFGTGHACNEFCTRKLVKTVVNNDGTIRYYTFGRDHIDDAKIKGQFFSSSGWYRFDVDKANDQDKNFYMFWAKISDTNNKKLTFIRETVTDGKVTAQNTHTLNKM